MDSPIAVELDRGWTVRQAARRDGAPELPEVPATVPGCVHTDLVAAGLIGQPFFDANEHDVAWVAACDWAYACEFEVTPGMIAHDRIELAFDGLDTLATVSVNGHLVGRTANMHRRYRFGVGDAVTVGANRLEIVFHSAAIYAEERRRSQGVWPSASFGRPFNYVRKMACSWGWDWGPQLTTAGIWRPARLEAWSHRRLSDIRPQVSVDAMRNGAVLVDVDTVVAGDHDDARVRVRLTDPDGNHVTSAIGPAVLGTTRLALDAGCVELWWPHSYGAQPLYRLDVALLLPDDTVLDVTSRRVGFRTIRLDTTPDATGSAFTFVVNGRPIFVRGVNWIPDDIFVSNVTESDYRERLTQARQANADLVRVWGGGIYEDDRFYDTCDEFGLLVWQDFLFACAAYPEQLLAEEVAAEAHDNVSRLMHHASLAIWNGNNENIWGYWDWQWEDVLQGRSWGAGFYHELLPRICAELDPHRPYWPGSPWSGSASVAPNADAHGCVHVWDVWNQLDLTRYRDHTPRFVAEFGWQAPPSYPTMAEAVSPHDFRRDSPAMRNHQKAADGDRKLDRGIQRRLGDVTDVEAFWYAAHAVQARAIQVGVEHFRSLRPYCMGTIWWQLNDCWPAVSWSVVDSAGRPKPSWYALRQAYRPRLLTIQPRGDRLVLIAVNDSGEAWHVDTLVRRIRLDGAELATQPIAITVASGATESVLLDGLLAAPGDAGREALVAGDAGERAWWWFAADERPVLRMPRFTTGAEAVDGGVAITLTADTIVRGLAIYPERVRPDGRADRQWIDLVPGEPEVITLTGLSLADVPAALAEPAFWHAAAAADR